MDKLVIKGGHRISGNITASGSKNTSLPIIAATLLTGNGTFTLHRIPDLKDITTFTQLLRQLGAETAFSGNTLQISSQNVTNVQAPYELVKKNEGINLCAWTNAGKVRSCKGIPSWWMCFWAKAY